MLTARDVRQSVGSWFYDVRAGAYIYTCNTPPSLDYKWGGREAFNLWPQRRQKH